MHFVSGKPEPIHLEQPVAIVSRDAIIARALRRVAKEADLRLVVHPPERAAVAFAQHDVVLLGVARSEDLRVLEGLRHEAPDVAWVVIAGSDEADSICPRARALGAQDCLGVDDLGPALLRHVVRQARVAVRRLAVQRGHEAGLWALFDQHPDPAWLCDEAGLRMLAVNRAALHMYGFARDEFLQLTLGSLRVEGGAAPSGARPALERHRCADGSAVEVELRYARLTLDGRQVWLGRAREVGETMRTLRALQASERRFRNLFESSSGYLFIHDCNGLLLAANPAAASALGYASAELPGRPVSELIVPARKGDFARYLQRIEREGRDTGIIHMRCRSGAELIWQYRNRLVTDGDGPACVICNAQDVTALHATRRALAESERRLRAIADALPLQIAYVDQTERLEFANQAWQDAQRGSGCQVGMHLDQFLALERYSRYQPFLQRALAGERVVFEDSDESRGAPRFEVTLIPERSSLRAPVAGLHLMRQDVTAQKKEEERLLHLARTDPLSSLWNRAGFHERLGNALARSRDQSSLLALFYLDVDRFKAVNDRFGHTAGDQLIHAIGARLLHQVRSSDVVARLGGDEFAIVMEAVPDRAFVEARAAALVKAMGEPFNLGDGLPLISVGASIGVVLGRATSLSSVRLLAQADVLLYAAKRDGRNTWKLGEAARDDAAVRHGASA